MDEVDVVALTQVYLIKLTCRPILLLMLLVLLVRLLVRLLVQLMNDTL